jgi:hypothetical protein
MKKAILIISILAFLSYTDCSSIREKALKDVSIKEHIARMKKKDPEHFKETQKEASILIADETVYYIYKNSPVMFQALITPNDDIMRIVINQLLDNHIAFDIEWGLFEDDDNLKEWKIEWDVEIFIPDIR